MISEKKINCFTLFLNGRLDWRENLAHKIQTTHCIGVDGGIGNASKYGIIPELWIGDFDSSSHVLEKEFSHVPRLASPKDKDKSDLELAVDLCLNKGADSFIFAGAFGGTRTDHIVFNIGIALKLAMQNIPVFLTSGKEEAIPILPGKHNFDYPQNTLFSLFPFSSLDNVNLTGAQWPLFSSRIEFGSSRTLSNKVTGVLELSFESGSAALIAYLDS